MSRGFRIERTEILCVLFDSELMFACLIHPVVSSVVQKLGIAINEIFEVFLCHAILSAVSEIS